MTATLWKKINEPFGQPNILKGSSKKSAHLQSFKNLLIMNCQSILFVLSLWDTTFKFLKHVLLHSNLDLYMTNAFFNPS